MVNVSSKKRKTILNPERPYTDLRARKTLCLAIRKLGNSGDSAQELLYKMYKVISESPENRKKVREMPKHDKDGENLR